MCRKDKILKLTIEKKIKNKTRTVKIVDSLAILTDKLSTLCKKYEIDFKKGDFPHKFSETCFTKEIHLIYFIIQI